MLDFTAAFEAMMANVTAPPLSLDEFRLFVACNEKARNALAFCEWYQRYRTVYFDRTSVPSTRMTAASSRPAIPTEFVDSCFTPAQHARQAEADQASTQSLSIPSVYTHGRSLGTMDKLCLPHLRSISALSESLIDSAFNTASTGGSGSSNTGRGSAAFIEPKPLLDYPPHALSGRPHQSTIGFFENSLDAGASSLQADFAAAARRRTVPLAASDMGVAHENRTQEENRQLIQSLLVFESWARFFGDLAQEQIDIPQSELLYIKERLPLNVTHIPRPLLCHGDMLATTTRSASLVRSRSKDTQWADVHALAAQRAYAGPRRLVAQRSLQPLPYGQPKRNLASHVQCNKPALARAQTALSLRFNDASIAAARGALVDGPLGNAETCSGDESINCNETSAAKSTPKLRRISTMPALKFANETRRTTRVHSNTGVHPPLPRPTRAKRLISVGELQAYHNTLKPRPPFATVASDRACMPQACGYRPVPKYISRLIVPNSVPPALFDTAARVSADYLLQHCFAEFYRQAHYNVTKREQRLGLLLAMALFLAGAGTAVALVLVKAPLVWRCIVVPFFLASVICASAAWTRVNITRWGQRKRPTSLVRPTQLKRRSDCEAASSVHGILTDDLSAIRIITGTFAPLLPLGFVGTVHSTGGCSRGYAHAAPSGQAANASASSVPGPIGTISAISLWSHYTLSAAVGDLLDLFVKVILGKRSVGDHWFVDLDSALYEVAEPIVLREQCYVICHQVATMLAICAAVFAVLFLIP